MTEINTCQHCGGDKEIRNPKGNCDHLYYPENCEVCQDRIYLKIIDDNFVEKLKGDFKKSDIIFNSNALKAFALGAIFRNQNSIIPNKQMNKMLNSLMDIADKL